MSAESVIYLLVLLVPIVSLDLPKVDVSSLAGARSYEMTVECPEGCLESVSERLPVYIISPRIV